MRSYRGYRTKYDYYNYKNYKLKSIGHWPLMVSGFQNVSIICSYKIIYTQYWQEFVHYKLLLLVLIT